MTNASETPKEETERVGLQMARALDGLWSAVMRHNPDTPEVVLFVSPRGHENDTDKFRVLGHFAGKQWAVPGQKNALGEVNLQAAHMMERGPDGVLSTVLHEAAHAIADFRGITETSQNHRYHNKSFAALAEEVGLVCTQMDGGRGWAHTELAEGTLALYSDEVKEVQRALIELDKDRPKRKKGDKRPGPLKCVCECASPRVIRVSPKVLDVALIKCEACGSAFAPEVKDEEGDS